LLPHLLQKNEFLNLRPELHLMVMETEDRPQLFLQKQKIQPDKIPVLELQVLFGTPKHQGDYLQKQVGRQEIIDLLNLADHALRLTIEDQQRIQDHLNLFLQYKLQKENLLLKEFPLLL
jgi:hypothetical protein